MPSVGITDPAATSRSNPFRMRLMDTKPADRARLGWRYLILPGANALLAWCCVGLIAALPMVAFYPAIMNADSLALYAGAVIPGPVMDWHSPLLTWLLRLLIALGGGVAMFVALQSAIYCFALYGVLSRARIGIPARLAILTLIVLAP